MAFYKKLAGPALDARRKGLAKIITKASKELKLGADKLIIRPLRPEDIGGPNPEWTFASAAGAWTSQGSTTIADNRFVSIYGFAYGIPDYFRGIAGGTVGSGGTIPSMMITQIRITRAGRQVRYWDLDTVKIQEDKTIYVDDPFTIDQNQVLKIETYNPSSAVKEERLIFLGDVVEKRGLVINP